MIIKHFAIGRMAAISVVLFAASGCMGTRPFDVPRYTLDLRDSSIPVMLSDTRVRDPGRAFRGRGIKSELDMEGGKGGYYRESKESVLSASEQIRLWFSNQSRFIQIRTIDYYAEDVSGLAITGEKRRLQIEAEEVK